MRTVYSYNALTLPTLKWHEGNRICKHYYTDPFIIIINLPDFGSVVPLVDTKGVVPESGSLPLKYFLMPYPASECWLKKKLR